MFKGCKGMKKLIVKGVVFLLSVISLNAYSHDFTWDNLLVADAKLTKSFDYEVYVDSYMQIYREPVWKKYRDDEFELESKRQETIKIMKDRFEQFDLSQEFIIHTFINFNEYDFDAEEFPLEGFTASSYFPVSRNRYYSNNVFPNKYKVSFENYDIVKNLKMDKSAAKQFVQNRKDRYGKVDRKIPIQVKFKVQEKSSIGDLRAEITEVILYESKNRNTILETY